MILRNKLILLMFSFWLSSLNLVYCASQDPAVEDQHASTQEDGLLPEDFNGLVIQELILRRFNQNSYVTDALILNSVPYQIGEEFALNKTTRFIKKLYSLGRPFGFFDQVVVSGQIIDKNHMNLIITTYEKPTLVDTEIVGNSAVGEKEIKKALNISNVHGLANSDLPIAVKKLQRLYRSNDYHFTKIDMQLEPVAHPAQVDQDVAKTAGEKVKLVIKIEEGRKTKVRKVLFQGNHHVPAKRLRSVMYTREDWLFGIINKAGSYRPENLVADKHFIKSYYKSNGYLMANIASVQTKIDEVSKQLDITFVIEEGDCYTIDKIAIEGGSNELNNDFLLAHLPVKSGDIYSEKNLRDSIEALRMIWGEYGYAFIEVNPSTVPNLVTKKVNLTFYVELGNKIHVNRINIIGNRKTRDKVIRRKIALAEGDLLTLMRMDVSKSKIQQLGYFDLRDGVNWKMHRLDHDWADLDLILKEKKTGHAGLNMGYGGGANTMESSNSFRIGAEAYDTNVFGRGYLMKLAGEWSKDAWSITTIAANPWLFDRPIMGKVDFHVVRNDYDDELKNVNSFKEQRIGASSSLGFVLNPSRLRETSVEFELAFDDIRFNERPRVKLTSENEAGLLLQSILDKRFRTGGLMVFANLIRQDFRNSGQHPSSGYQWSLNSRLGFGIGSSEIGYARTDLDASWYTALIGEHDLIFGIHTHFGAVTGLGAQQIPYKEMFHVGGPVSVRGYLYGQIGPSIRTGEKSNQVASIGSSKEFFVNAELIFPITGNMSIKGAFFYDGGAGWDTPGYHNMKPSDQILIQNNSFDFRHAIGFGIRMIEPQPIKIDWGLKLDPRNGEPHSEWHFSTYREF
jgi:outer membrane protein insertion porin family